MFGLHVTVIHIDYLLPSEGPRAVTTTLVLDVSPQTGTGKLVPFPKFSVPLKQRLYKSPSLSLDD